MITGSPNMTSAVYCGHTALNRTNDSFGYVRLKSYFCGYQKYEPRHEKKRLFAYAKTKMQISCAVTTQLTVR